MKYKTNTGLRRSEIYSIGLIALHWSYLEHAVELLIWAILEMNIPTGRAITSDLQMRGRLKILRKLIDAKHAPMSKIIEELEKTIQNLERDRNLIVHGLWRRKDGVQDPFATSLRRSSGSPDTIYGERFPRERMDEINTNIVETGAYVEQLIGVIDHANEPSRKKSETPTQTHPSNRGQSQPEPTGPPQS